jgi:hypothetical protein
MRTKRESARTKAVKKRKVVARDADLLFSARPHELNQAKRREQPPDDNEGSRATGAKERELPARPGSHRHETETEVPYAGPHRVKV